MWVHFLLQMPLMLIVGDSRVKMLDANKNFPSCQGWNVECLYQPGATLDRSLEMIEEWRITRHPEKPRMIVLVSFLCDVMEVVSLPGGFRSLKIRESVKNGKVYPALIGLKDKIREVEGSLKRHWRELEIIWVNPYVVDVRRWTTRKVKDDGGLSVEEIKRLHKVSYQSARYFEEANKIGTHIPGMADRFYSWFLAWNDKYKKDLNYDLFMDRMPSAERFGWINHRRTVDGLHPTAGLARQLIDMLYRKAALAVLRPTGSATPVAAVLPISRGNSKFRSYLNKKEVNQVNLDQGEVLENNEILGLEEEEVPGVMENVEVNKGRRRMSVVERLTMSPPEFPSSEKKRSNGLGKLGSGCCMGHGTILSRDDYIRVSLPCGHTLPIESSDEKVCSPSMKCFLCDEEWESLNYICTSFHYLKCADI